MRSFEEIDRLRDAAGLTRRALYRRAEVDGETWRRTEKGRTEPNLRTLRRLSDALDQLLAEQERAQA